MMNYILKTTVNVQLVLNLVSGEFCVDDTGGIFLLLGYSATDEALLRPYTNLGVQDAIRGLQHYLVRHVANQVRFISRFNCLFLNG